MSARLCVLGSGSGGNGSWVSLPSRDGAFECFIDAGLSPKATGERLRRRGLLPIRPRAVILTHADTDHWRPTWAAHVERLEMRVLARREHHRDLLACGVPRQRLEALVPGEAAELAPGVTVDAIPTPHDEHGSTALRFESTGGALGWLTDLGRAEPETLDFVRGCDVVAIESNYCPRLQHESRRPPFLKARIMGGRGHLSNEECLEAIMRLIGGGSAPRRDPSLFEPVPQDGSVEPRLDAAEDAPPRGVPGAAPHRVVLLHLSRDCNRPARIRELWLERLPDEWPRVILSSQETPTPIVELSPEPRPFAELGGGARGYDSLTR